MADIAPIPASEPGAVTRASLRDGYSSLLRSALLGDSLSYFASKVVPGLMGLASVPVFIRLVGLDQYGRFAVTVPILMAVASAGSGWLAQGVLRFHPAASDPREHEIDFDLAVTRGTIISVLVTSVAIAAAVVGVHSPFSVAVASLAYCLALLIYTVTLAKAQARLRPEMVLRREIIRSIGGFVIPVGLVIITGRKQFELLVLGQATAYLIGCVHKSCGLSQARLTVARAIGYLTTRPPSAAPGMRQLWRFGWAVGLWLLLSQGLPVIDRWTIQRFATYTDAGVYASLYEIAVRSFSFLVFPVTQAAHPRIMRAWNGGKSVEAYRIIRVSVLLQLAIFAVVLGGVFFASQPITRLILGFDDPTATPMLPVLLLGGFLWQLALLLHKPLEIAQRTGAMLAAMAGVMVLNVIACFEFIPLFGYQAASYILVFSAGSYIALTLCLTRFGALRRFASTAEA